MWLVKNLNFKTATFQFFLSQSHQNQVMLQWRTCAQETRSIIDDISRCKCRIVSWNVLFRVQAPFWIRWDLHHRVSFARSGWVTNRFSLHIRVCFVPNSITCRTFFAHFVSILVLFVSVIRWHARAFHGRWPNFFSPHFQTLFETRF